MKRLIVLLILMTVVAMSGCVGQTTTPTTTTTTTIKTTPTSYSYELNLADISAGKAVINDYYCQQNYPTNMTGTPISCKVQQVLTYRYKIINNENLYQSVKVFCECDVTS